ncbi:hypothetical protein AVEN_32502-1 [Araneus ventricosus]|uniref:Uncharacterized protein n=1 Tax=Araneus ventricosus TaxID=182803 RepID=A0A4Y2VNN9_ARAVE|nr:hypothetical protein AVEN_32502-1 [Araneus ventricosus]
MWCRSSQFCRVGVCGHLILGQRQLGMSDGDGAARLRDGVLLRHLPSPLRCPHLISSLSPPSKPIHLKFRPPSSIISVRTPVKLFADVHCQGCPLVRINNLYRVSRTVFSLDACMVSGLSRWFGSSSPLSGTGCFADGLEIWVPRTLILTL